MSFRLLESIVAEGAEHENSTTEGAFQEQAFAAYFWQDGKVVEFAGSVLVNDNNSTDTLTGRVRFGASQTPTSNTALVATGAVDSADGDIMNVHGYLQCRTIDREAQTATIVAWGSINDPDAEGQAVTAWSQVVTSVDISSASYLQITGDWSVAHADNEAAIVGFVCKELTE